MADNKLLGAGSLYYGGNEISKAYMGNNLVWEKAGETGIDYSKEYFCIESINGNTQVSITTYHAGYYRYVVLRQGAFEYMEDFSSFLYEYWDDLYLNYLNIRDTGDFTTTAYTQYNIVTLENPGERLIILGNTEVIGSARIKNIFTFSDDVNVGGNIMSLSHGLDSNNDPVDPSTLPNKEYTARIENTTLSKLLYRLFKNLPVVDASNLVLSSPKVFNSCYSEMFRGCTSLISGPAELPATTLTNSSSLCYASMFHGCTSLTTAPILPATTLVSQCYYQMFRGCTSLNYIKAMFTTTPGSYTSNWVNGVSATGTFVKNSSAEWDVTGVNGIPEGWTVQTASS